MNELDWLNDARPEVPAPDEETTAWARAALLAYAAGETRDSARAWVAGEGDARAGGATDADEASPAGPARSRVTAAAGPARSRVTAAAGPAREKRRGRRGPRKAPLYALAVVVFGIAIVVGAGALPSGDDGASPRIGRIVGGPAPAEAALVKFARRIQQQPAPTGDATLVQRSHHFPDGSKDFTGADLYLDDGRYFYGMTMAELKAAKDDIGEGVPKLEREAAKAAIGVPVAQARRKMIDATFGPKGEPAPGTGVDQAAEQAARRKKLAAKLTGPTPTPAPKSIIDNNRVWIGSMDALIAGAGNIEVRAGVMQLISTIGGVKVTDHGATLDIRNTEFPDGYAETLTVDAKTGVIQKMTGGVPGKTPEVVVDYEITRVDAEDVLPALR
ncbi:hypothetical protein [Solirubrobacter soli]|uniref:hypothetical protein n=1 Tax=Solirubrobacter soli TaxID=363832 RepID=UPI00042412B3|nr:hypothetical protein [Solirubrobacter soli]